MGARFVINTRYFHIARPGEEFSYHALSGEHVKRLVEYCATRETVSLSYSLDKTAASRPATQKQIETIEELKQMVSDYKETLEYKDYAEAPTIKNASELISRLSELALLSSDSIGFNEVANLIEYAANRPGVVKVGEHGLFSSTRDIDLTKVAEEMSTYGGNIWTDILSLRREDASVCGYESQEPWRNLILSHIDKIAKAHHIKLENLCWYGAMHNTGCHPHVHLFVYSKDTKEGYLGKKDIKSLKSTLAPAIFKNELISTYQQKDNYLKDINLKTERLLQDLIENPEANFKNDSFQKISDNLVKLSQEYKGKAKYGFQPKEVKKLVNEIQTLMISNNEALNELYKCWCNEQLNIESLYINNPTSEYPIESNPSFTRMKNIIMEQAEMLRKNINPMNRNTFTEEMPVNRTNKSYDFKNTNSNRDNYKPSINKELNNYIKEYPEDIQIFESQTSEQIDSILIFENDNNSTKNFKALFQLANDLSTRNGEICRKLADCYYYGHGTDKNIDNAIMWYGIGADSFQDSMASYKLGQINLHGCENIETDKTLGHFYCEQAFYLFKNEIENGKFFDQLLNGEKELFYSEKVSKSEAYKEYLMGLMFLKGDGLKKDFSNAYESLLLAATNGYTHANYYIGNMYYCGLGFEQSYENALNYYKKAAEKNDNYAKCKVAEMYINGKGTEKNINIAISWLESAAKSNNPDAAYQLGYIYSSENYGLSNGYKSKLYYLKALNNYIALEKRGTNQTAEYRIGMILLNGLDGNKRPIETALKWLNKAALNGNSSAAYQLGKIFDEKQEINNAVKYFEIASELGNPYASFKLGNYSYENGDIEAAVKYYATASENNIANASFKLGKIFSMENSILQNNEKSEFYFAKALNQYIADFNEKPDGFSAYCIAWLYQNGKGIQANTEEAEKWYKISSDYGNSNSAYQLGKIFEEKQEINNAVKYFEIASKLGNPYASFKLGNFSYENGDIETAAKYYATASENNIANASFKLGKIFSMENSNLKSNEKSESYFAKALNQYITDFNENPDGFSAYCIAWLYQNGKGIQANTEEAEKWYKRSSDCGNSNSAYQLGKIFEEKHEINNTVKYFEIASKLGNPYASFKLGNFSYENGDIEAAVKFYATASENNIANASFKLGKIFSMENSILKSNEKSEFYFAKALNQYIADFNEKPDGFSAYCIAWLYQNSKGIQANTEEAEKWYKLSSDYGNPDADYQLGYIYKDINKNELSKKHFAASLHKYIELFNENPNDYLAFKIGSFYQYGLGTEYDISKAVEWYKKSEELGNKKAVEKLEEIKKSQSLSASCVVTAACHFGRMINTETIAAAKNKIKTDSKVLKREKIQKIYAGQAFDDVEQSYDY